MVIEEEPKRARTTIPLVRIETTPPSQETGEDLRIPRPSAWDILRDKAWQRYTESQNRPRSGRGRPVGNQWGAQPPSAEKE